MKYPQIIGLHGYAGVGKSKVAAYLQAEHGYVVIKFAAPIKAMARAIGLSADHIEGELKEVPTMLLDGHTPRQFMQLLGTEFGRKFFGEDFWVNRAMEMAYDVIDCGGGVVIDDCRFPNEAKAIQKTGVVIKVTRPGVGPVNAHSSDNQNVDVDAEIVNSGTVVDLCEAVDLLLDLCSALPKAHKM